MIKIDFLKNRPHAIPALANIWHEVLGKIWMPEIGIEEIESLYHEELNQGMPLTYIALYGEIPVGSCTLQLKDDVRPDLGPWIESLVEKFVQEKVLDDWSPEQISGYAKRHQLFSISHERIYQFILADKQKGGDLYIHLRHQYKKYRKRYGSPKQTARFNTKSSLYR